MCFSVMSLSHEKIAKCNTQAIRLIKSTQDKDRVEQHFSSVTISVLFFFNSVTFHRTNVLGREN